MTINVGEALDSDTGEIISVERLSTGSYVDGVYVEGSVSVFKTLASAQQPTPQELQMLPGGERNSDVIKFYCKRHVYNTEDRDNIQADRILYAGNKYRIIKAERWDIYGYTVAYGARIK